MKKGILLSILFFGLNAAFAQVEKNVYELNSIENLLTKDVEGILDTNLKDKKVVLLGESNHYFGADFLAKTEFVKYLVLQKGYKDIAFEYDFFTLYFDHDKTHLLPFWSNSVQCRELFEFLKEHDVTIWGFDNQIYSKYTRSNFLIKLTEFLKLNGIEADQDFIALTDTFFKNASDIVKTDGKQNIQKLLTGIENLLKNDKVIENQLWFMILENYKSFITMSSAHLNGGKGPAMRDSQMAKNLDFLVKAMPEKKFMVWLHNAHMIKDDYGTDPGQTMGYQFVQLNPNGSYHIAVSSINMPYRKAKKIEKYNKDKENLLSFLPTTERNYFIDAKQIISENPEYATKNYEGMFVVRDNEPKTNWFKHYDALVFISKGVDVEIAK